MLTKIHGHHVFECDACSDTLQTNTKDFTEALRIMRAADWRARQIGQDWVHTCFGCEEEAVDTHHRPRGGKRLL